MLAGFKTSLVVFPKLLCDCCIQFISVEKRTYFISLSNKINIYLSICATNITIFSQTARSQFGQVDVNS